MHSVSSGRWASARRDGSAVLRAGIAAVWIGGQSVAGQGVADPGGRVGGHGHGGPMGSPPNAHGSDDQCMPMTSPRTMCATTRNGPLELRA
jgi:hypothetical protein